MQITIRKPKTIAVNTADYQHAADLMKQSVDLGSNTKAAASGMVRNAYLSVMANMSKLDNLAKRSEARQAVAKALLDCGAPKSKVKRLTEQSALFLQKFGSTSESFIPAAKANNTGLMAELMEGAKITTEANIIRFNKGETENTSPAEKLVKRWAGFLEKEDLLTIENEASVIIAWLSANNMISSGGESEEE